MMMQPMAQAFNMCEEDFAIKQILSVVEEFINIEGRGRSSDAAAHSVSESLDKT